MSIGRRKRARRELEERRLSRAVRADNARPRTFGEMRGDAAEKRLGHPRIGEGDVVELEKAGHDDSLFHLAVDYQSLGMYIEYLFHDTNADGGTTAITELS